MARKTARDKAFDEVEAMLRKHVEAAKEQFAEAKSRGHDETAQGYSDDVSMLSELLCDLHHLRTQKVRP